MRRLFVCGTPFQALNVLNMQWNVLHGEKSAIPEQTDLYLIARFGTAEQLYEKIAAARIFSNVRLLQAEDFDPKGSEVLLFCTILADLLRPEMVLTDYLKVPRDELPRNAYDHILASQLTPPVAAMLRLNPDARFDLFDDGTGSYKRNIIKKGHTALPDSIARLLLGVPRRPRPDKLYVNNIELCKSVAARENVRLPEMTDEFIAFASEIFGSMPDALGEKPAIYLTQPYPEDEPFFKTQRETIRVLQPYREQVKVRMHPRDKDAETYAGFEQDSGKNMWELTSARGAIENKVLISVFSSAQITPKMLFDKEPWLIFTNHLTPILGKNTADQMINDIRKRYRRPEKVLMPKTEKEFRSCMEQVLQEIAKTQK